MLSVACPKAMVGVEVESGCFRVRLCVLRGASGPLLLHDWAHRGASGPLLLHDWAHDNIGVHPLLACVAILRHAGKQARKQDTPLAFGRKFASAFESFSQNSYGCTIIISSAKKTGAGRSSSNNRGGNSSGR